MFKVESWFRRSARNVVEIDATELRDLRGQMAAISRSQAVIEFALDGTPV